MPGGRFLLRSTLLINGLLTFCSGILPYVHEHMAKTWLGYALGPQKTLLVWALPATALGASVLWALLVDVVTDGQAGFACSPALFGQLVYHALLLVYFFELGKPQAVAFTFTLHALLGILTLVALLRVHAPVPQEEPTAGGKPKVE